MCFGGCQAVSGLLVANQLPFITSYNWTLLVACWSVIAILSCSAAVQSSLQHNDRLP